MVASERRRKGAAAIRVARGSIRSRRRRHVFVCGTPRSGTSALKRTLEIQPAFGGRSTSSPETRVFQHPSSLLLETAHSEGMYDFVEEPLNRDETRRILAHLAGFERARTALDRQVIQRISPLELGGSSFRHRHRWYVRALFEAQVRSSGCDRVVEKTPKHVWHIGDLLQTFVRAQVIALVRDPVTTFASHRKRLSNGSEMEQPAGEDPWLRVSPGDFALRWSAEARLALSWSLRTPLRVRLVRYEDLTEHATDVVEDVMQWLDAPFDPEAYVLRTTASAPPDQGKFDRRAERRIEPSATDWREFVGRSEAALIRRRTSLEAGLLGYLSRWTDADLT